MCTCFSWLYLPTSNFSDRFHEECTRVCQRSTLNCFHYVLSYNICSKLPENCAVVDTCFYLVAGSQRNESTEQEEKPRGQGKNPIGMENGDMQSTWWHFHPIHAMETEVDSLPGDWRMGVFAFLTAYSTSFRVYTAVLREPSSWILHWQERNLYSLHFNGFSQYKSSLMNTNRDT